MFCKGGNVLSEVLLLFSSFVCLFKEAVSLPVTSAMIPVAGNKTKQITLIGQDTKAEHHQQVLDHLQIILMGVRIFIMIPF